MLERSVWDQNRHAGQYNVSTPWTTFALASGDGWPQVRGRHSQYYVPVGEDDRSKGGDNAERIQDPISDELIDAMAAAEPGSVENTELVTEFLKNWIENMYSVTAIAFKKFVTWDEKYWTGFPTAENPEYMPLYWFQGGKYAFQSLEPVE